MILKNALRLRLGSAAKPARCLSLLTIAAILGGALPAHAGTVDVVVAGAGNWSDSSIWPALGAYRYPGDTPGSIFNYTNWNVELSSAYTGSFNPYPAANISLDVNISGGSPTQLTVEPGATLTNAIGGQSIFNNNLNSTNQAITNAGTINIPIGNIEAYTGVPSTTDGAFWNQTGGLVSLTGTGGITFDSGFQNDGTLTLGGASNTLTGVQNSFYNAYILNDGLIRGGGSLGTASGGEVQVINETGGIIDANSSTKLVIQATSGCYEGLSCGVQNNGGTVEVQSGDELQILNGVYTQTSGMTKDQGLLTSNSAIDITGGTLGAKGGTITATSTTVSGTGVLNTGDPATTTINGAFNLGAGGELYMYVDGSDPSDQDHIVFNGPTDLSGGTVVLDVPLGVNLNGLDLSLFTFNDGQTGTAPTFTFANGQNYSVVEEAGEFEFSGNTVGGASTPEPTTFGLFAVALALLLVRNRSVRIPARNVHTATEPRA